jgi:hypothetical protein
VDRLRTGAGIGLYADMIIGPKRLDFGAGEQNRRTIYFSAGLIIEAMRSKAKPFLLTCSVPSAMNGPFRTEQRW